MVREEEPIMSYQWYSRLSMKPIADDLEKSLECSLSADDRKRLDKALDEAHRLGGIEGLRRSLRVAADNRASLTVHQLNCVILSALPEGQHQWGNRSTADYGFQCTVCGVFSSHYHNEFPCIAPNDTD
jgi:hypothetical protein